MDWKSLPHWSRYGIIGSGIVFILTIIILAPVLLFPTTGDYNISPTFFLYLIMIYALFLLAQVFGLDLSSLLENPQLSGIISLILIYSFFGFITGAVIGLIISRIKK